MTKGGPRKGSGRPPNLRDTARNRIIRVSVTNTEYEVCEMLGKAWDVPTATAAYGLIADCIAKCRKNKAMAIPENIIHAASALMLRYESMSDIEVED